MQQPHHACRTDVILIFAPIVTSLECRQHKTQILSRGEVAKATDNFSETLTSREPRSQNSSMSQVSGGCGESASFRGATVSCSSSSQPHRLSLECMLQIWPGVSTDRDAFCNPKIDQSVGFAFGLMLKTAMIVERSGFS